MRFRGGIGSFFAYPEGETLSRTTSEPSDDRGFLDNWMLLNSGRAAIATVFADHVRGHPNATLWIPSYYCWDVTSYLSRMFRVRLYQCNPTDQRTPSDIAEQVMLDTTHDPFARWIDQYQSEWRVGSLRKTLPVAEGGYAYSRGGMQHDLGTAPASSQSRAAFHRGLTAMRQKAQWLRGDSATSKDVWYAALQDHEKEFAQLLPATIQPETRALLRDLPVTPWRELRLHNLDVLHALLTEPVHSASLRGSYGLVQTLPSPDLAAQAFHRLVAEGIYPARLWAQPSFASATDADLSKRLLAIPTDYRYSLPHMTHVAAIMNEVFDDMSDNFTRSGPSGHNGSDSQTE